MILKLLWPEICPFCGKVYAKGICPACEMKLRELTIHQPRCMKCGKPVRRAEQEFCHDCTVTIHHFDRGRALWLHKPPVSNSIYQFKYHNQRAFGKYYARAMAKQFERVVREWNPDCIIPIPLHKKRKRKRGYNQAQLLAQDLGRMLHISVETSVLKRSRYTNPQKKLNHRERKKNLKDAFTVVGRLEHVKSVLLIDDIYTTGNTIDEAAKKLKQAGVQEVYFLTISIGQGY